MNQRNLNNLFGLLKPHSIHKAYRIAAAGLRQIDRVLKQAEAAREEYEVLGLMHDRVGDVERGLQGFSQLATDIERFLEEPAPTDRRVAAAKLGALQKQVVAQTQSMRDLCFLAGGIPEESMTLPRDV